MTRKKKTSSELTKEIIRMLSRFDSLFHRPYAGSRRRVPGLTDDWTSIERTRENEPVDAPHKQTLTASMGWTLDYCAKTQFPGEWCFFFAGITGTFGSKENTMDLAAPF